MRLGFEVVPSAGDDARGEIRAAFPFGRLRRNGPEGLELVEIQLHKRRAAAFRLNIGIAPPEGVDHFTGQHIAQEDIWVGYLDHFYELYRSPMFRIWFAVRRWSWSKRAVTEGDCGALVDEVIGFLPEVEQALREGRAGPHVRRIG
ncbi:MAG TPA: hypothetical protein VHL34_16770 [Rhizomicrobium sp.]|nr:hypothetical protein [Rhizomicrobium sp.]